MNEIIILVFVIIIKHHHFDDHYIYISISISIPISISVCTYIYINMISIYLSIYLPTYLSIYLSFYLSLSIHIYIYTYIHYRLFSTRGFFPKMKCGPHNSSSVPLVWWSHLERAGCYGSHHLVQPAKDGHGKCGRFQRLTILTWVLMENSTVCCWFFDTRWAPQLCLLVDKLHESRVRHNHRCHLGPFAPT